MQETSLETFPGLRTTAERRKKTWNSHIKGSDAIKVDFQFVWKGEITTNSEWEIILQPFTMHAYYLIFLYSLRAIFSPIPHNTASVSFNILYKFRSFIFLPFQVRLFHSTVTNIILLTLKIQFCSRLFTTLELKFICAWIYIPQKLSIHPPSPFNLKFYFCSYFDIFLSTILESLPSASAIISICFHHIPEKMAAKWMHIFACWFLFLNTACSLVSWERCSPHSYVGMRKTSWTLIS